MLCSVIGTHSCTTAAEGEQTFALLTALLQVLSGGQSCIFCMAWVFPPPGAEIENILAQCETAACDLSTTLFISLILIQVLYHHLKLSFNSCIWHISKCMSLRTYSIETLGMLVTVENRLGLCPSVSPSWVQLYPWLTNADSRTASLQAWSIARHLIQVMDTAGTVLLQQ
jgi:hypothetical protein